MVSKIRWFVRSDVVAQWSISRVTEDEAESKHSDSILALLGSIHNRVQMIHQPGLKRSDIQYRLVSDRISKSLGKVS